MKLEDLKEEKSSSNNTAEKKKEEKKKVKEKDPMDMKTIMKIPFQRAPVGPSWLTKKKAGRKLNPIEANQWLKAKFEEEHQKLLNESKFEGVPTSS